MLSLDGGEPIATFRPKKKKSKQQKLYIQDQRDDDQPDKGSRFISNNSSLMLYPTDQREIVYIYGPSGSGKSTIVKQYAECFHEKYPDRPIYMFSTVKNDETIVSAESDTSEKDVVIEYVPLDEDLVNNPINIADDIPSGSLVIFDDCATIENAQILKAVEKLQDSILETGRHCDLYCLVTNHQLNRSTNRHSTNMMFNEMHRIVFFPHRCNRPQVIKLLTNHFGLIEKQARTLLNQTPGNCRWMCASKKFPNYVLTPMVCCLMSQINRIFENIAK